MIELVLSSKTTMPDDAEDAVLVARIWSPQAEGPSVAVLRNGGVWDITAAFPTVSALCEVDDPARGAMEAEGTFVAPIAEILDNTRPRGRSDELPYFLAPLDLQAIKAAGVTFVASMLERVIEERARGNADAATGFRAEVERLVGADLRKLRPGSDAAAALKQVLIDRGAWSQYLEVGIGPDAEIFTKSQPMSAIGTGMECGLHPKSGWNNPEPEIALAVSSKGRIVGAMLGNDVNLRDVEGRSALLLGKAKDNNASCALGPFLRLFDQGFGLDDVRKMDILLRVDGPEGYRLEGGSSISLISRDPEDLVAQMIGPHHQYPDGAVLFLGTMFAPVEDRDQPGLGFTHKYGDIVTVSTPRLGSLTNVMQSTDTCPQWTFGVGALIRNLAARGLLGDNGRA